MTLAGLFTAEGRFEGEGVVGKEAGRKNREGVYYPQESRNSSWAIPPFGWQLWKQLPGIYSLCADGVPAMSQLSEQQVVEKVVGLWSTAQQI